MSYVVKSLTECGFTKSSLRKLSFDCGNADDEQDLAIYIKRYAFTNDLLGVANNFKVLLTMVSPSRKVGELATESLSNQGIPIFKNQIRLYSAYEIAATNGCLVHQARDTNGRKVSNSGIAWSDYLAVGNEL